MKRSLLLCLVLAPALQMVSHAAVTIVDDFEDGVINPDYWTVWLPSSGTGNTNVPAGSSVTETGGGLNMYDRGYLNTTQTIVPTALAPVQIRGTWYFSNTNDFLQILTRSSGNSTSAYGETNTGIEFRIVNGAVTIAGRGITVNGAATVNFTGVGAGDTFDFAIFDNGTNLVFDLFEVGNPANTAHITATATTTNPTGVVTFHNREGGYTSTINAVSVVTPEPSRTLLLGLTLFVPLFGRWRKVRANRDTFVPA